VAISIAFISACGTSKADTTAQLYNGTTVNGGQSWNASLSLAGATLTSNSWTWGSKTKLNNCDTQTATLNGLSTVWTFPNVVIICEKHNLYTLGSDGRPLLSWTTGSVK
jgi:hypothetical protein